MKFLIYGGNGWIGKQVCEFINRTPEYTIVYGKSRIDNIEDLENEIMEIKPDRIFSLTGRTSGPGFNTIDYLEQKDKLIENIRDNLKGPLQLATLARKYSTHYTYLGTGCIFNGYDDGFTESDKPNFYGSAYSTVKGVTDELMHLFEDTVLNIRIRMPINSEVHPKNFITKMMTYENICSIENSMTVLPEIIPLIVDMSIKKVTGTINCTNPGLITHNEILEIVKEIINPNLKWKNFTIEEQSKILLGGRSNNFLNTSKLEKMYPDILPIKEAVRKMVLEMKNKIDSM